MYHYDAFISYNHNPRDLKITQALQRKLENYNLPRGVVSSTGKKKIERVFLDKGELGVSGDLNEIIRDALEHSDKLIVICSPESRESIWVHREIEFFLRNHSLDDILTVITEGDPYDVLPEALLYEYIDDGDGNTICNAREPLSCDYRLPLRRAEREELPRLVAAMVGCQYDDLVQRQKHYRMKRQIALLSSAAVLLSFAIGYLIWSNQKIRTNYEQSLREESLNLAVQSEKALSLGDRIGAIRYALDALPSEDKDRPVVSEAVLALSNALGLYHSSQDTKWTAVRQYSSDKSCVGAVPFTIDEHEYIAARFSGGRICIWDAESGSELMSEYTEELFASGIVINSFLVIDDGSLLLVSNKTLFAIDVAAGKERYSLDFFVPSAPDESIYTDDTYCYASDSFWITVSSSNNGYFLLQIDTKKGEITFDIPVGDYYPELLAISDDGGYLAYVHEIDSFSEDMLELINTKTGNKQTTTRPRITDVRFDDSGSLLICGCKERPAPYDYSTVVSSDYIKLGKGYTYAFALYADRDLFISSLKSPSLDELWSNEYSGYFCGMPKFEPSLDSEDTTQKTTDIVCTTGSRITILDKKGNSVEQLELNIPVMFCNYSQKEGTVKAVLNNGSFASFSAKEHRTMFLQNVFIDKIRKVVYDKDSSSGSFYVISDNNTDTEKRVLTQYVYNSTDSRWEAFDQEISYEGMSSVYGQYSYDDLFFEFRNVKDDNTVARLISRKADSGEVIIDKEIPAPDSVSGYNYDYVGTNSVPGKAYFINTSENPGVLEVDVATGNTVYTRLASSESVSESFIKENYNYKKDPAEPLVGDISNGVIYCPVKLETIISNPVTGKWEYKYSLDIMALNTTTKVFSLTTIMELPSGDALNLLDIGMSIDAENKLFVMADSNNVLSAYDFGGTLKWKTEQLSYYPQSVCMTDDGQLLVVEQTEPGRFTLHVYRSSDGKESCSTELGYISDKDLEDMFYSYCEPLKTGETLMVWGQDAFVMDPSDWSLQSKLQSFMTYNAVSNLFILGDTAYLGDKKTGSVPYRTLDEIIAEGREVLGE